MKYGADFPHYRLATAGLGLLSTILLTVAIALGVYCNNSNNNSELTELNGELKQLRANYSRVIVAVEENQLAIHTVINKHQQLSLACEQERSEDDVRQKQMEDLRMEKEQLTTQISSLERTCSLCSPGWEWMNSRCYYFASLRKSWEVSRQDCISRGADLVVIDTKEKQDFITVTLNGLTWYDDGFWIGLHNARGDLMDGRTPWTWVNGTEHIYKMGYWKDRSPVDIYSGKNCALTHGIANSLKTWTDAPCNLLNKWICERGTAKNYSEGLVA